MQEIHEITDNSQQQPTETHNQPENSLEISKTIKLPSLGSLFTQAALFNQQLPSKKAEQNPFKQNSKIEQTVAAILERHENSAVAGKVHHEVLFIAFPINSFKMSQVANEGNVMATAAFAYEEPGPKSIDKMKQKARLLVSLTKTLVDNDEQSRSDEASSSTEVVDSFAAGDQLDAIREIRPAKSSKSFVRRNVSFKNG
jgi:hypothetical protein